VVTDQISTGGWTLAIVSLKDKKLSPFLPGGTNKANGQVSPDGKWIAYESEESDEWEVYISTYPVAAGKLQVSRGGGQDPRWRGDGKEIFYIDPKGTLVSVAISSEGSLTTGAPTPLFQTHARGYVSSTDFFTYDVAPDGKRFLIDQYVKPSHIAPLSIILHATSPAE
jgi:eukaryotic-like serine/threonine-protein kinase